MHSHLSLPWRVVEIVRRAFAEFLRVPCAILIAFMLLAAATWLLDHAHVAQLQPLRTFMRDHFFRDSQATSDLLATIAGSIITVTSITFSMLLLAVQQAAGALTHQVYDQFLRRRVNQVYFGFFVGLAVYTLLILASVDRPYNPVFGAVVALVLTIVALMLIVLLLYTTVNQMRPVVVVDAIHDRLLLARERQREWLARTRRTGRHDGPAATAIRATTHGYVVRIDVDALAKQLECGKIDGEIHMNIAIGASVCYDDVLAELRAAAPVGDEKILTAMRNAIHIEQQRDLDRDPAFGVAQMTDIAWTSISTAKSNPAPGLLVIHSLRDVLARWLAERPDDPATATLPIVYRDDQFTWLLDSFEVLTVVASESMQPQTIAALMDSLATMFPRLPASRQDQVEQLILRSLSALGEHVLTRELSASLVALAEALQAAARPASAARVDQARQIIERSYGKPGSRATRVRGE